MAFSRMYTAQIVRICRQENAAYQKIELQILYLQVDSFETSFRETDCIMKQLLHVKFKPRLTWFGIKAYGLKV